MKEIKFKIYDKKLKETHIEELQDLCEDDYWYDGETYMWSMLYDGTHKQERFVISLYTGLKDINGVEIYKGDIVAEKGHFVKSDRLVYQKIQWKENYSCWLRGEYQRLTPKNIKTYQIEVIGNIYENPELLEGR